MAFFGCCFGISGDESEDDGVQTNTSFIKSIISKLSALFGTRHQALPTTEEEPLKQKFIVADEDDQEDDYDNTCPTCFEVYTADNPKMVTKCNHHFHLGCIYDWKERSPLCPVCDRVLEFEECT